LANSTFLVTGAQGFIGAWVIKQLLAEGATVVGFDASSDPHRLRSIISDEQLNQVDFITGDITDPNTLTPIIESRGISHIIHLAGLQVPTCKAKPRVGGLVNVIGTINVFDAVCRSAGQVKKIVYASSAAVFGPTEDDAPLGENDSLTPMTHYGVFKYCNEGNARVYFLDSGISSIGLRPLTVYGVGRDFGLTSDVTKAMKAAVIGRPYHIRFGGRTDLLYAADTADAFIKAAHSDLTGAFVFNVHGETRPIADVISEIETVRPESKGTITHSDASLPVPPEMDGSAIRNALGDLLTTSLADGTRETIEQFALLKSEGRLDIADLDV
jgi:Nucleoside-diphosphate-sugar epimerases